MDQINTEHLNRKIQTIEEKNTGDKPPEEEKTEEGPPEPPAEGESVPNVVSLPQQPNGRDIVSAAARASAPGPLDS